MRKVIALEARLRDCCNVITLGVRPNFSDYSAEEIDLIRSAPKIYYPTTFYADLFDAAGIKTFPSYHTYKCVQDKIKQTALFQLLQIPHPRTRIFYGQRQKSLITQYFTYPFIGKIPRGSAMGRGVYLIEDTCDLKAYLSKTKVAYIQEYHPCKRDVRAVIIGRKVVHAYWRIAPPNDFRTNVAVGGSICFDNIPQEVLDLAQSVAARCQWDDVGIDIGVHKGNLYVFEGNMKYGREGFRKAGKDYTILMEDMIDKGEI